MYSKKLTLAIDCLQKKDVGEAILNSVSLNFFFKQSIVSPLPMVADKYSL